MDTSTDDLGRQLAVIVVCQLKLRASRIRDHNGGGCGNIPSIVVRLRLEFLYQLSLAIRWVKYVHN